ncbi:NADH dehydrogenase [ubiquinone] 1 alpha subcomplex subunit 10, mitochondrial isoform X2 [Pyxicephalus adspersus]|uniref:NADH dehydrogenase [ubiquinone] 1 alpha subcomplex subunit 10, mitochondrial isoform X2 n=1 Tax=Pyxicephalus adspersus TaxID=30357 RepID=UPI003B5AB965
MFGTAGLRGLRLTWKAGVISVSQFHVSSKHGIQYGYLAYILGERTTKRFGPNSKIITVDGNLASGKGKVAKDLAERLGMKYFPEADQLYIDKCTYNENLPPIKYSGLCSLEKFYEDPKSPDGNSYRLQNWMFSVRMMQYADVLEHLLSTGQGVVMERSAYSDFVFLEAMLKNGYIRPECVDHYNEIKNANEKKVALPYLQSIEDAYKTSFLPKISETTEVLQYSGGDAVNVEQVAEDLEYIKITKGPWLEQTDISFHHLRMLVQDKCKIANLFVLPTFVPEVTIGGAMYDKLFYQYRDHLPGKKYAKGYNSDIGDKYVWLK